MRQNYKEFIGSLTERARSPFFASFAVSWLIFNWRIPAAILLYSERELIVQYKKSQITYITCELADKYSTLLFPFLSAIVYIIIFKVLYKYVDGWIFSTGNKLFHETAGGATINFESYAELENRLHDRESKYAKSIQTVRAVEDSNKSLHADNIEKQEQIRKFVQETNKLEGELHIAKTGQFNFSGQNQQLLENLAEANKAKNDLSSQVDQFSAKMTRLRSLDSFFGERQVWIDKATEEKFMIVGTKFNVLLSDNSTEDTYAIDSFIHDVDKQKVFMLIRDDEEWKNLYFQKRKGELICFENGNMHEFLPELRHP